MSAATDEVRRATSGYWLATGETAGRAEHILAGRRDDFSCGIAHLVATAENRYGHMDGLELREDRRLLLPGLGFVWSLELEDFLRDDPDWRINRYTIDDTKPNGYWYAAHANFDWFGQAFERLAIEYAQAANGELG